MVPPHYAPILFARETTRWQTQTRLHAANNTPPFQPSESKECVATLVSHVFNALCHSTNAPHSLRHGQPAHAYSLKTRRRQHSCSRHAEKCDPCRMQTPTPHACVIPHMPFDRNMRPACAPVHAPTPLMTTAVLKALPLLSPCGQSSTTSQHRPWPACTRSAWQSPHR